LPKILTVQIPPQSNIINRIRFAGRSSACPLQR